MSQIERKSERNREERGTMRRKGGGREVEAQREKETERRNGKK